VIRLSNVIDEIHVVFENVEHIEIPYSDVRYIYLSGITESIWDNNILFHDSFKCKLEKTAKFLRLMIKDKPEYDRVKQHNDITHIELLSQGKSIHYIALQWAEGSSDYTNIGQKVITGNGVIDIWVEQKTE
jgi:hypothetical protein